MIQYDGAVIFDFHTDPDLVVVAHVHGDPRDAGLQPGEFEPRRCYVATFSFEVAQDVGDPPRLDDRVGLRLLEDLANNVV